MKKGFSFISILISLLILAIGILSLIKVFPVITKLSKRWKRAVSVSIIADKIFTLIEKIYGEENTPVPDYLSGTVPDFPGYYYTAEMKEEKDGLYKVELEIKWKEEGKYEKKYFYSKFRKK